MSELESLAARATELSTKVDFWNNAVLVALLFTALAAAAIVVAQRKAFVRAGELSTIQERISDSKESASQSEQMRIGTELAAAVARAKEADARIAEAQRGSAEANARATKAQESLALAEQHAAEANTKSEGFRLDIAKANESSAKAEARAAEANLELAKLRDPRRLLPEQQDRIIGALRRFAGQKFSFNVYPDPEPIALLRIIDALLKSAGWERIPSQMGAIEVDAAGSTAGTAYDSGVDALIAPGANDFMPALLAFATALTKEGIPCTPHTNDGLIGKTPKAILINVGKKP